MKELKEIIIINETKFYLGRPCRREHIYQDTGKTLRSLTHKYHCIECHKIATQKYRQKNKKEIAKRAKEAGYMKKYYENNKEKVKQYYTDNKEMLSQKRKKDRQENPEKYREYDRRNNEQKRKKRMSQQLMANEEQLTNEEMIPSDKTLEQWEIERLKEAGYIDENGELTPDYYTWADQSYDERR